MHFLTRCLNGLEKKRSRNDLLPGMTSAKSKRAWNTLNLGDNKRLYQQRVASS